jgi:hypothetical protein
MNLQQKGKLPSLSVCPSACLRVSRPSAILMRPSLILLVSVTVRLNPLISFMSLSQTRIEPCTCKTLWQACAFYISLS